MLLEWRGSVSLGLLRLSICISLLRLARMLRMSHWRDWHYHWLSSKSNRAASVPINLARHAYLLVGFPVVRQDGAEVSDDGANHARQR